MNSEEFSLFLDRISDCFVQCDFLAWESCVLRPFTLITKKGPVYLATRSELEANFNLYLAAEKIMRIDQIVRQQISIEDCKDGTFIGTYKTELLSKGHRAVDPYISSALIHDTKSGWRMSVVMGANGHHDQTGLEPTSWET